jgi:hypothetical protein
MRFLCAEGAFVQVSGCTSLATGFPAAFAGSVAAIAQPLIGHVLGFAGAILVAVDQGGLPVKYCVSHQMDQYPAPSSRRPPVARVSEPPRIRCWLLRESC